MYNTVNGISLEVDDFLVLYWDQSVELHYYEVKGADMQTFSVVSFLFSSCKTELAGFLSYFCACVIALIAKMFQPTV